MPDRTTKALQKHYETDLDAVRTHPLDNRSKALRSLIFRAIVNGGRGHIGPALSLVEIIRVLYDDIMNVRPTEPAWDGRDRFILSKGHGCLAQYVVLADKGYFPLKELDVFCHHEALLGGHPEIHIPGVEASTGALGHGLPIGVGQAVALRAKKSDARVFVVMGDGEINEGSVWEAAAIAAKHNLSNLIAVVDYNKMQSAGSVLDIQTMEPMKEKWRSFGFRVLEANGHDVDSLRKVFAESANGAGEQPTVVVCHTVKGKGIPTAEWDATWHHKSNLKEEELEIIRAALEEAEDA